MYEWDINIYRGILTGFNEAFIISGETKDALIKKDPKSAEIIRPILRGRDIKRYGYTFKELYIICTFPSRKINIDSYPAIRDHLLSFGKDKLEQTGTEFYRDGIKMKSRKRTQNLWFETQDTIAYWEDFNKQKIIYSEIVQSPKFYLDSGKFYIEATAFMITGKNLNYITCMLNSEIVSRIFRAFYAGGGLGSNGFRYKKRFLNYLPLPIPTDNTEKQFESLMSNLRHTSNSKVVLDKIDELVISLLNLSDKQKSLMYRKSLSIEA